MEAVYAMSIMFLTIATVVNTAYHLSEKTRQIMRLHTQVEIQRHMEVVNRKEVTLQSGGVGWHLEIKASIYNPEEWMRMISLSDK